MTLGELGAVVVLRCSFTSFADAFKRDSETQAEEGWDMLVGANEARFAARAHGDATLVMPRISFESGDDLAVHLREILGDALDEHEDDRGIAWLPQAPSADEEAKYDAIVDGEHDWIEKVPSDDERLNKASGWMFGAAAKGLKTEAKVVARVEASASVDPLQQAKEKLDGAAEKREDRSSLRRSLGAAVGSSFLDSPLAKQPNKPDASDLGKKPSGLADALTGSSIDKVSELEASLREAVEGDIAASVGLEEPKTEAEDAKAGDAKDEEE